MFQLNGETLQYGKAFVTEDGRQFPANFLSLATAEEKEALGIINVPDSPPAYFDGRFYFAPDIPRELDSLKSSWTLQVKQTAASILDRTDWYVIRQAENSAAVPAEVLSERALIRTLSNEKETAIAACADVAALAEYVDGPEYRRWEALPEPEPEPESTPEPTPEPEPTPTETPAEEE